MCLTEAAQLNKMRHALIDIYLSGYATVSEYAYTSREDIWYYLEWLFRRSQGGFFLLLHSHLPRGFISTDPEWKDLDDKRIGEIHELVVTREFQGKGAGSLLLNRGIDFLYSREHRRIGLWVGVHNYPAIHFYLRHGFKYGPIKGIWQRMYLDLREVTAEPWVPGYPARVRPAKHI